jgi:hypothetical protein
MGEEAFVQYSSFCVLFPCTVPGKLITFTVFGCQVGARAGGIGSRDRPVQFSNLELFTCTSRHSSGSSTVGAFRRTRP